jgi:hypothetical protein
MMPDPADESGENHPREASSGKTINGGLHIAKTFFKA